VLETENNESARRIREGLINDSHVVHPSEMPEGDERIRWIDALCAPKVALYGFAFFCIKFSIYAILLWMPIFLS